MRHVFVLAATAVLAGALVATAAADRVYHTDRLELKGVGGAPGGGAVVNIHPNGPNVFAHEIYTLKHAAPGQYQVSLNVFPASLNCTGSSLALPTATLTTNAIGNGRADVKFTPEACSGVSAHDVQHQLESGRAGDVRHRLALS